MHIIECFHLGQYTTLLLLLLQFPLQLHLQFCTVIEFAIDCDVAAYVSIVTADDSVPEVA